LVRALALFMVPLLKMIPNNVNPTSLLRTGYWTGNRVPLCGRHTTGRLTRALFPPPPPPNSTQARLPDQRFQQQRRSARMHQTRRIPRDRSILEWVAGEQIPAAIKALLSIFALACWPSICREFANAWAVPDARQLRCLRCLSLPGHRFSSAILSAIAVRPAAHRHTLAATRQNWDR
jgi:hypothetical protein